MRAVQSISSGYCSRVDVLDCHICQQPVRIQALGPDAPERERAVEWLREILSSVDSLPSKETFKLAKEQGFNEKTLQRAKKELGIKCFQIFDDDGNNSWHWRLHKEDDSKKKIPGLSNLFSTLPKIPKAPNQS